MQSIIIVILCSQIINVNILEGRAGYVVLMGRVSYFTFTFMHLADAFIQSDFYSGYTFFFFYQYE